MTNLDIDHRLAKAIGYAPGDMRSVCGDLFVRRFIRGDEKTPITYSSWERFDHQECRTIYPIAEKYALMPSPAPRGESWDVKSGYFLLANDANPRTCVALAIIAESDRGLLT